jgi:hypothetical protein
MKTTIQTIRSTAIASLALCAGHPSGWGASLLHTSGFLNGGAIPDGNPAGWSDTRTVTGIGGAIASVTVSLSLSGGWNGDYYAFLSHGTGFSVLLNRVGRTAAPGEEAGYGDNGLTLVFDDTAANGDVHLYQGVAALARSGAGRR